MPNAEKVETVAEISERFSRSSAAVITEYRGLTVKQVTQLRRSLGRDTTYAVVKNTLTKRAASDAGVAIDEALLARIAGALKALPTRAAGLFQAPLSQMARLAKALEEKKQAAAEASAAPAAEAPPEDALPVEADAAEAPADAVAADASPQKL